MAFLRLLLVRILRIVKYLHNQFKFLHAQSHGESFLSLFDNRFEQGLYILDEPESALSPQRQLSFLKIIYDLEVPGRAQFIIASHSPYPSGLSGRDLVRILD